MILRYKGKTEPTGELCRNLPVCPGSHTEPDPNGPSKILAACWVVVRQGFHSITGVLPARDDRVSSGNWAQSKQSRLLCTYHRLLERSAARFEAGLRDRSTPPV